MKAVAVTPGSGNTRMREMERPRIASDSDVLVRMIEVGVCGTDSGICGADEGTAPDDSDYLVPGHEGFGEVAEVGAAVKSLKVGDLVVPMVRRPCEHEHCPACRSGNQDFCTTGDFVERGIKGAHGFAAEYIVESEKYLCPVPPDLRDVAVMTEPQSIAEKGLRQYLAIQKRLPWLSDAGDARILEDCRAVVLGGGPIGLLGCLLLRLYDVPVIVYSRTEPPAPEADIADAVGAQYVSSEQDDFETVVKKLGGVTLVYEATGAAELMFEVMEHLAANAVFLATGVPGKGGEAEVEAATIMHRMVMKNQVLCGTVNASRADFESAIRSLGRMKERWPDALAAIITHRRDPAEFCDAAGSADGLKHIVRMSG
jgi:glucose 1-dehydrogenase